ncbi:GGDEF domain-containing protein [Vibrio sp. YMD68]|uniref:GGDEF domain-containing protein n=1 Tax=Vibrio sp. YMD68 TaxID=3042300 RepID=UPI00249C4A87|nr:GGDEF domain-containing protein [Vibrio sp. YMD68]WGV98490.1 GGDEF domain-containing protein [Vibrio sp. YMD68]
MKNEELDNKICEVACLSLAILVLAGTTLRPLFNEQHYLFTLIGCFNFLIAFSSYWLIKTKRVTQHAATLVVTVTGICLVPLLWISGGLFSQFNYLIPVIPVFTCLFANWKVVLAVSISLISLVLLMYLKMHWFIDIDQEIHYSESKQIAKTFWLLTSIVISAALGYYHRAQNQQIKTLLHKHAYVDPLTEIGNRRFIETNLSQTYEQVKANEGALGVMLIDIDHFKKFNDNFGHETGDKVLKEVAQHLDTHIGSGGLIGRFGGEEFLIVLPELSKNEFEQMGNSIVNIIHSLEVKDGDIQHRVTVSIGGYWQEGARLMPINKLVKLADNALYKAKSRGRNQFIAHCQKTEDRQELSYII